MNQDSRPLGRDAWISAALEMLSSEGIEGVRVEILARNLGITKGSFYHHFKDRDDLHAAMLDLWRRRMVVDIIEDLERVGDPLERFRRMMRVPTADSRADFDEELAVRLWARRDPRALAALEEVDSFRLDFIGRVLVACGVPPAKARPRAVLAFSVLRAATPFLDEAVLVECEALLLGA